jgi:hypothetical protein
MVKKEVDPDVEKLVKDHPQYKIEYNKLVSEIKLDFSKYERLALVFRVCQDLAPANSMIQAKLQLDTTLNVVEDGFSKVNFAPSGTMDDGRMYPAQEDYRRRSEYEQIATYEHRSHYSYFGDNGSINVTSREGKVLFDKVGADNCTIGELRERSSSKFSSGDS